MIACRWRALFASALTKSGLDIAFKRYLMNGGNPRRRRSAMTTLDHGVDLVGRAGEDGLDRAIGKILHPTIQSKTSCGAQGPTPVPNALNPPLDADAYAFPLIQWSPPRCLTHVIWLAAPVWHIQEQRAAIYAATCCCQAVRTRMASAWERRSSKTIGEMVLATRGPDRSP